MKTFFSLSITVFALLAGCSQLPNSATSNSTDVLDLRDDKNAAEQLWTLKHATKPSYPKAALISKQTGCARFIITIDKQGNTTDIRFVESFPEGLFIDVSRESLKNWQWQASKSNSESRAITRTVQLDYFMKEAVNMDAAKAFCTI
ncbi:energy transducer TonB [Pseudoalteromonas shioyasakiensis]|uniref:energy transducer TonB n=1 Tax=Pseudoalteromonas shioyasakiensis TaxID=1190813 RepID=UPI001C3D9DDA|nr:energy transducer TonB [Pseudoalteromonas shioyasakiensis]